MRSAFTATRPASWDPRQVLAVSAILAFSLLAGLAAGDRSVEWTIPMAAIAGAVVLYAGTRWPFTGLLIMLASSILLVVVLTFEVRSVNAFDVLLMPVFLVSLLGRARMDARLRVQLGERHDAIRAAERRFTSAVIVFHVGALLSLIQLGILAGMHAALDSGLVLLRAVQGLLLYPICRWWLHGRARIESAWNAIIIGGVGLFAATSTAVFILNMRRPGMTLFLNDPTEPFKSPNEAGVNALFVAVVILVRHAMRPDWKNIVGLACMVMALILTESRSAMLALAVFALFTIRWANPGRLIAGGLSLAALLPLVPIRFWERMAKSLVVERGSFEAMSFLQRVYGWQTAWKVVQDHPWTGIGYLGFRFISDHYNNLRLQLVTVENYFYEILVSMGVVGLLLIGIVVVRLFQLGPAVARSAPKGTLAYHMARAHTPLMAALLAANLTGDNFLGLVSLTQLALWCAVLVQSGHEAVAGMPRA